MWPIFNIKRRHEQPGRACRAPRHTLPDILQCGKGRIREENPVYACRLPAAVRGRARRNPDHRRREHQLQGAAGLYGRGQGALSRHAQVLGRYFPQKHADSGPLCGRGKPQKIYGSAGPAPGELFHFVHIAPVCGQKPERQGLRGGEKRRHQGAGAVENDPQTEDQPPAGQGRRRQHEHWRYRHLGCFRLQRHQPFLHGGHGSGEPRGRAAGSG